MAHILNQIPIDIAYEIVLLLGYYDSGCSTASYCTIARKLIPKLWDYYRMLAARRRLTKQYITKLDSSNSLYECSLYEWRLDYKLHRDDDQPAFVIPYVEMRWCVQGKTHRGNDMPARLRMCECFSTRLIGNENEHVPSDVSRIYTVMEWYKRGVIHRSGDLPAYIDHHGVKRWFKKGKLHRKGDLPAYVSERTGMWQWFKHGKLHRKGDKPALVSEGVERWYKHGKLHRKGDKPAVVIAEPHGWVKQWFKHDKCYRKHHKPTTVHSHGLKEWSRKNGETYKSKLNGVTKWYAEEHTPYMYKERLADGTMYLYDTDGTAVIRKKKHGHWKQYRDKGKGN